MNWQSNRVRARVERVECRRSAEPQGRANKNARQPLRRHAGGQCLGRRVPTDQLVRFHAKRKLHYGRITRAGALGSSVAHRSTECRLVTLGQSWVRPCATSDWINVRKRGVCRVCASLFHRRPIYRRSICRAASRVRRRRTFARSVSIEMQWKTRRGVDILPARESIASVLRCANRVGFKGRTREAPIMRQSSRSATPRPFVLAQ